MNLPEFHTQHVFIIGEDERDQQLVREAINDLPYLAHVSIANSGKEAVSTLKDLLELPDLIFLDLEMSPSDGLVCLREIKGDDRLASLPIIIFSSTTYPAVVNETYSAGAHLYVSTSDGAYDLKKIVHHLLSINWKAKISPPPREEFVLAFRND